MLASRRSLGALGTSAAQRRSAHVSAPRHISSSSSTPSRRRVSVAVAASSADLHSLLAQKERELAAMFESGRPMPAAAVVAGLRSEIAALDAQLNGRPAPAPLGNPNASRTGYGGGGGGGYGGGGPAPMQPPSSGRSGFNGGYGGGGPAPVQPPSSGAPAGYAVRSRTEQLADRAYEMVEQQMMGSGPGMAPSSQQGMGQPDDVEVARLEHENTQLRAEAYALLQRQQQLESMLAEVRGQKEPELLLESAEGLLARMKAKLQKSQLGSSSSS